MGAGVLHPEAIFPVSRAASPINIRKHFEPDNPAHDLPCVQGSPPQQPDYYGHSGQKELLPSYTNIEKSI